MTKKLKKKKLGLGILLTFVSMITIGAFVYKFIINISNQFKFINNYNEKLIVPISELDTNFSGTIFPDNLKSANAILVSLKDNSIQMEKNSEEKIFPASMTKIMTAIIAIENIPDFKKEIKLTNYTFEGLFEANASMAGFQPGEKVNALDLIYGALLPSGAEACIGLAEYISGSEDVFVELMNQKASELDMENTHFENTTGLHDDNHYTTVKDMAILLRYSLQNDIFREVFTSYHHSTKQTNKHPDGITFYSTLFNKLNNKNINNGEIIGGKTGYTDEAGLCLASLAKVGRQEYILVTAGADGDQYGNFNIVDALTVYNSIGK